ncbi:hypothetical protein JCGZ_15897 [Jatropha curcas]|uniref:Uncharacterized protein n=1 Tax=Jatropha curcas TaxID=180498 RepID=A0A067LAF3_JATCU|nr:protein SICKLE isoform X2 [Jatropha curcas]KDP41490.1 hypothetical protein JCGZ_15897 [Jatropha curcas]
MEEDSERRRERLKAMRTVAAQAEASSHVQTSSGYIGFLANPLLESPELTQEPSHATPRFDFYTDPMAAFYSNKKRSGVGNQAPQGYLTPPSDSASSMSQFSSPHPGPRNPDMTPFPSNQMQHNYSPYQIMDQTQVAYNSIPPCTSPRAGPFPMHQGMPYAQGGSSGVAYYHNNAPHRGMTSQYHVRSRNPNFQPEGNHSFNYGQGRPLSPRIGNNPYFGSGRGGSSTHSGRGQGQWHGSSRSQVSGRNGGRGRGFYSHGIGSDAALRAESFYDKSMVEDPWQRLEPVLWKGLDGSSDSWLPKSASMKKPRVSESSNKSSSQNLAEYLAAAFNESVNDAPST